MNDTDEKIIYRERPSWLNYYLLYGIGLVFFAIFSREGEILSAIFILLMAGGFAAVFRYRYLFVISEDRIIAQVGLIARNTTEMRIKHIRTMMIKQSVIERLLGIGTLVTISAAEGEAAVEFKGIRDPVGIKEKIRGMTGG